MLDVAIGEYNADVTELQEAAKKQLAQRGGIFSEKASFLKDVNGKSKMHYICTSPISVWPHSLYFQIDKEFIIGHKSNIFTFIQKMKSLFFIYLYIFTVYMFYWRFNQLRKNLRRSQHFHKTALFYRKAYKCLAV